MPKPITTRANFCHRLLKSGLRFSLNAAMPSSASSDTNILPLERQPEVERAALALRDRELRVADRHARSGRELRRILDRACAARGRVGKEPVDDADLFCLGGLQGGGIDDEVQPLRLTDQSW